MKSIEYIQDFLNAFVAWASEQDDIQAIALVGSYARSEARDDSDIDLVILTDRPEKYLESTEWTKQFGAVEKHQIENYGKLTSLRVWYQNGIEAEYGFTAPDWAEIPLDAGTQEVIHGGMSVLFERVDVLSRHTKH
jgi:predicted nucleotidyltransferase